MLCIYVVAPLVLCTEYLFCGFVYLECIICLALCVITTCFRHHLIVIRLVIRVDRGTTQRNARIAVYLHLQDSNIVFTITDCHRIISIGNCFIICIFLGKLLIDHDQVIVVTIIHIHNCFFVQIIACVLVQICNRLFHHRTCLFCDACLRILADVCTVNLADNTIVYELGCFLVRKVVLVVGCEIIYRLHQL